MKLRTRMLLLTVVAIAAAASIGYIGVQAIEQVNQQTAVIAGSDLPAIQNILNADRDLYQAELARQELWDSKPGTSAWDRSFTTVEENMAQVEEEINKYAKYATTKAQLQAIQTHKNAREQWKKDTEQFISLLKQETEAAQTQAQALETVLGLSFNSMREPLDFLTTFSAGKAEDSHNRANSTFLASRTNILVVLGASVLVLLIINIIIIKGITGAVKKAVAVTNKLAEGDLSDTPSSRAKDEMGILLNALGAGIANIRTLIGSVALTTGEVASAAEELNAGSEEITGATEQIAATMQQLSSGSQQQVMEVEQATTTAKELNAGIQDIAMHIQNINDLSARSRQAADNGNSMVTEATKHIRLIKEETDGTSQVIKELGAKSEKIAAIVDMITGIADQTNLLALNAAIEAARAGEQGKGFAVVAEEVRKLAEESSNAATEIAGLIGEVRTESHKAVDSMNMNKESVDKGADMIEKVNASFGEIDRYTGEVSTKVQEVSATVQQLTAGSEQFMATMDNLTHIAEQASSGSQEAASYTEEQNASMEEISASAEKLAELAQNLTSEVRKFKLDTAPPSA